MKPIVRVFDCIDHTSFRLRPNEPSPNEPLASRPVLRLFSSSPVAVLCIVVHGDFDQVSRDFACHCLTVSPVISEVEDEKLADIFTGASFNCLK